MSYVLFDRHEPILEKRVFIHSVLKATIFYDYSGGDYMRPFKLKRTRQKMLVVT